MARSDFFLSFAGLLWIGGVVFGFHLLWQHSGTPAPRVVAAPATWPAASAVKPDGRFTLVMAVHPRCPCTRASMGELAELLSRTKDRVAAHLLFLLPDGTSEDWLHTEHWTRAAELGAVRHVDRGGLEAQRFGAVVSGHTVLYDPSGRLAFSGGITAARGHMGDNQGRQAVVSAVQSPAPGCARTPTFGCLLAP